MRKLLAAALTCAMSLAVCPESFAGQPYNDGPDNEIWVAYSPVSITNAIEMTVGALESAISAGNLETFSTSGNICAGYHRKLNDCLGLGAEFVYNSSTYKFKNSANISMKAFSPMVSAKAAWLRREHIALYSRLGAGVLLMSGSGSVTPAFAFQLSPIGFEFGGRQVRGFVEGGFGMSGFVNGGIKFGF